MTPPTDLELMMYFDGELDELRSSEVRAFLATSTSSRAKLDGLSIAGDVLRDNFLSKDALALSSTAQVDSIVDDVMKKIATPQALKISLQNRAPETASDAALSVKNVSSKKLSDTTPAANDNGRRIFALSALAAAAAAALFLWGRNPPAEAPTAAGTHSATDVPAEASTARAPSDPVAVRSSAEPESVIAETEEHASAEIAAVDFGSRAGALYYVSGDTTGSNGQSTTTTVVWLTDE